MAPPLTGHLVFDAIDISWLVEIHAPANIFLSLSLFASLLFFCLLVLVPCEKLTASLISSTQPRWTSLREYIHNSRCWACTCHSAYRHRIILSTAVFSPPPPLGYLRASRVAVRQPNGAVFEESDNMGRVRWRGIAHWQRLLKSIRRGTGIAR